MSKRAVACLLGALATLTGCDPARDVDASRAVDPIDNSLIAFTTQTRRDPMPWVAIVGAEGGDVERLHEGSDPSWSPDGERLVFACHPGICVMDPDGRNVQRLTRPEGHVQDESPDWGPTGYIAFTRTYLDFDRGPDILTISEDGGQTTRLIEAGSNFSPAWSPEGNAIAFIRGIGHRLEAPRGGFQLWTMDSHGANLRKLTTAGASQPDWAPDGRHVVFDAGSALWLIPSTGGSPERLGPATTGGTGRGLGAFPSWSPDGSRIVYTCQTGEFDDNDLCVVNADGTGRTTVLDSPANEASPAWQTRPR